MQHPSILTENALTKLALIEEQQPLFDLTVVKVMLEALHNQLLQSISSDQNMQYWERLHTLATHVLQETRVMCGQNISCRPFLVDLEKLSQHIRLIIQEGSGELLNISKLGDTSVDLPGVSTSEDLLVELRDELRKQQRLVIEQQTEISELKSDVAKLQKELRAHTQECVMSFKGNVTHASQVVEPELAGFNKPARFEQPVFNTDSKAIADDFLNNLK